MYTARIGKMTRMAIYEEREQADGLECTIAGACRLAATGAVTAVHVVVNRRPTYQELLRYRELAEARNLTLTVLGSGGVTLRPCVTGKPMVDHRCTRPGRAAAVER